MNRNKLFFWFTMVLLWVSVSVSAQTDVEQAVLNQTARGYNQIAYAKRHFLCRQGEDMNVVDVDLEWPECLNGSLVDSLQAHLQRAAFSCQAPSWQDALVQFVARYGEEVKGPLSTLPDDNKFCYVNCDVKELGLWKGRFATFEVTVSVMPHQASSQQKSFRHEIVAFDLQRNELLKRDEVLRISRITDNPNASQQFSQLLLTHTSPALGVVPSGISLGAQVGVGNQLLMVPYVAFDEAMNAGTEQMAYLPIEQLGDFLTKDFQKRLTVEPTSGALPVGVKLLDDTGICKAPSSTPELMLSDYRSIGNYLVRNVVIPEAAKSENPQGRVLAAFVVNEDGTVGDIDILRSASPTVDREVVNTIRLMPRLRPAMKNGKPVKVRMFIPVVFKS